MSLLHKLDENQKAIEALLELFNEQDCKPLHIGKAMEKALSLVDTLSAFLNEKAVSTPDDKSLIQAIEAANKAYQAKKDKYKLSLKEFEAHRQKIKQAEEVEKQHFKMIEKIASAVELLASAESKTNKLREEHNQVVADIKNWQEAIVDIEEKHKKNVAFYQKHFERNDQILKEIAYAPEKPHQAIDTLSAEIKEKIEAFDKGLNDLVTEVKGTSIETISETIKKDSLITNKKDENTK